jgi:hypothetical protein
VVGSIRGFASLVKKEKAIQTSREVLVSKILRDEIEDVLDEATKMVNFIKQRPVHSGTFNSYENVNKQHIKFLLRTEIW